MLGRAASCCDLLRLSPTPGDSSEDVSRTHIRVHRTYVQHNNYIYIYIYCDINDRSFVLSCGVRSCSSVIVLVCRCRCLYVVRVIYKNIMYILVL